MSQNKAGPFSNDLLAINIESVPRIPNNKVKPISGPFAPENNLKGPESPTPKAGPHMVCRAALYCGAPGIG